MVLRLDVVPAAELLCLGCDVIDVQSPDDNGFPQLFHVAIDLSAKVHLLFSVLLHFRGSGWRAISYENLPCTFPSFVGEQTDCMTSQPENTQPNARGCPLLLLRYLCGVIIGQLRLVLCEQCEELGPSTLLHLESLQQGLGILLGSSFGLFDRPRSLNSRWMAVR